MKKLTREEVSKMPVKATGRSSIIKNILTNMNVGDIVLLEPNEWKQKDRSPVSYINRFAKNTGRAYLCLKPLDGSGWVIERTR